MNFQVLIIGGHYFLQAYMFKYDSTHGQWKKSDVSLHSEGHLTFGGSPVAVFGCRYPLWFLALLLLTIQ